MHIQNCKVKGTMIPSVSYKYNLETDFRTKNTFESVSEYEEGPTATEIKITRCIKLKKEEKK